MPATKAARPQPVGFLIDQMWLARERKRVAEAEVKRIEAEIEDIDKTLRERLHAEGIDKATGTKATVSLNTTTVAAVEDWDAFWAFILKNKYTHLLQRRVSDPAYRELLEAGKKVPGVQPFAKQSLNIRTL